MTTIEINPALVALAIFTLFLGVVLVIGFKIIVLTKEDDFNQKNKV